MEQILQNLIREREKVATRQDKKFKRLSEYSLVMGALKVSLVVVFCVCIAKYGNELLTILF